MASKYAEHFQRLHKNSFIFSATNMCEIKNGGCEQICEPQGNSGRYFCRCESGYVLSSNGRSCEGKKPAPALISR